MNELAEVKRRLSAVERAPAPINKFDRYPQVEWAAQGRPAVGGNIWSSVSIANVTGLTFDRVECKFITDFLSTGKREAEVRLAAFRHTGKGEREIVSASAVLNLTGDTERLIGSVVMRWVHGIPYGWDYANDTTIYTIELQHRYKVGPETHTPGTVDVFAFYKPTNKSAPSTGGPLEMPNNTSYETMVLPKSRANVGAGWVTIPEIVGDSDLYGSYSISAMHYCVGLPAERIPEASAKGWAWVRNSGASWGRNADITEPYFFV
ncbi:hypothetical protein [Streptomyces sp. NBC_01244]|uniref:hypothetical protein n=1 Tax=Streptomyces sp. NBC_01244 TaxID=2903797 RepID=UPI002E0FCB01|nr:hypothetical protein OG247_23410 [Streptomyces sp. NBC_01244]